MILSNYLLWEVQVEMASFLRLAGGLGLTEVSPLRFAPWPPDSPPRSMGALRLDAAIVLRPAGAFSVPSGARVGLQVRRGRPISAAPADAKTDPSGEGETRVAGADAGGGETYGGRTDAGGGETYGGRTDAGGETDAGRETDAGGGGETRAARADAGGGETRDTGELSAGAAAERDARRISWVT